MSGESAQARAAQRITTQNATYSDLLAQQVLPALQGLTARANNELGSDFGSIRSAFGQARKETGAAFDQAGTAASALTRQQALQSGGLFPEAAVHDLIGQQAHQLNLERSQAMGGLKFQEQQAKMTEFNTLMNTLGGVNQQYLGLGSGFGQAALGGAAGMSQTSALGGALGGAATGASLGTSISPGWGTLIGGVVGGAAGYLGSG